MVDQSTKPTRRYPALPDPGDDLKSHSEFLRAIRSALQTHERRDRDIYHSFIRLGELTALNILEVRGDKILAGSALDATAGGSTLEPGTDGYILATVNGEVAWVPFAGIPAPVISSTDPVTLDEDAADTVLTVTGTGFTIWTTATFDGVDVAVTYISSTTIEVLITAALLTEPGTLTLSVTNPVPGGGTDTLGIVVGTEWSPASITTQLWFDANDAGSITIATGVSQWNDKSGNARHVTQATGANQPAYNSVQLNGLATLSFDGTDDCLRKTGGVTGLLQNVGAATTYLVRRHTVATPAGTSDFVFSIADTTPTTARVAQYGATDSRVRIGGKRTDAEAFVQIEIGGSGWYVINVNTWELNTIITDYTNSDGFGYLNGAYSAVNTGFATSGSTSNTSANSVNVGCWIDGAQPHQGGIAEIIVTHSYNPSEQALVEGYLAHKWGLA